MESVQEEWRPLNGEFEGWPYEISNYGCLVRVRGSRRRLVQLHDDAKGYYITRISYLNNPRTVKLHRLVLSAFGRLPEPKEAVNHIDGNKRNNFIGNLEWVTPEENIRHAIENGLFRNGSRKNYRRTTRKRDGISDEVVRQITESNAPSPLLSEQLGLSASYIRTIRCGLASFQRRRQVVEPAPG